MDSDLTSEIIASYIFKFEILATDIHALGVFKLYMTLFAIFFVLNVDH